MQMGLNAQGLSPTEHANALARLYRARAESHGRGAPSRADWLLTLLREGSLWVSGYLVSKVGPAPADLIRAAENVEGRGDPSALQNAPWLLGGEVADVARELGHRYVGSEHVLMAFARAADPLGDVLRDAGLTFERIRDAFDAIEWAPPPGGDISPRDIA